MTSVVWAFLGPAGICCIIWKTRATGVGGTDMPATGLAAISCM